MKKTVVFFLMLSGLLSFLCNSNATEESIGDPVLSYHKEQITFFVPHQEFRKSQSTFLERWPGYTCNIWWNYEFSHQFYFSYCRSEKDGKDAKLILTMDGYIKIVYENEKADLVKKMVGTWEQSGESVEKVPGFSDQEHVTFFIPPQDFQSTVGKFSERRPGYECHEWAYHFPSQTYQNWCYNWEKRDDIILSLTADGRIKMTFEGENKGPETTTIGYWKFPFF